MPPALETRNENLAGEFLSETLRPVENGNIEVSPSEYHGVTVIEDASLESDTLSSAKCNNTGVITPKIFESDENASMKAIHKYWGLCVTFACHAYLLTSIYPYAGFMAMRLVTGLNSDNAGTYAGTILSAYMVGRACSAYAWGLLADMVGRKPVLYLSLVGSAFFSVLFGISPTYRFALLTQFLLGASNGLSGTVKTMVSELARGDERLETRGMGMVTGIFWMMTPLAPAISGSLAEPLKQYPHAKVVGHFQTVLARSPFLLPNLFAALLCLLSLLIVVYTVEETLPKKEQKTLKECVQELYRYMYQNFDFCHFKICRKHKYWSREESVPLYHAQNIQNRKYHIKPNNHNNNHTTATLSNLWSSRKVRTHLLAYWVNSFAIVCVDASFSLFCQSQRVGLGVSEGIIGDIMAGSGVIFILCQYFVYTYIVDTFGLYNSLKIGSLLSIPLTCLVPLSIKFNHPKLSSDDHHAITSQSFYFLVILMAIYRIFTAVFYSSITVAANRTVPAHQRATMNGISMTGNSVAKAIGPIFAGGLVTFAAGSGVLDPHVGAALIFCVNGLLGVCVVWIAFVLKRDEVADSSIDDRW